MADMIVSIQKRGVVALPTGLRRRLSLDQPGAQVRVVERDDGVIELHPMIAVPADQAWFWTERWQRMESEADTDIVAGRTVVTGGVDEFLAELGDD